MESSSYSQTLAHDDGEDGRPISVLSDPDVTPSLEDTDSEIAAQLAGLSMAEREEVLYDIHGISDEVKETNELIEERLTEFAADIQNMNTKGQGYEIAMKMDPKYVQDRKMHLRFLRSDKFNTKQAAQRYVRHFQFKLELFGKDKLVRDIVQDDLDKSSLDSLYKGRAQVLPVRDVRGRGVSVWFPVEAASEEDEISRLRRFYYSTMVHTEDVEAQKKGFIGIVFAVEQESYSRDASYRLARLLSGLPTRMLALHVCYDSLLWTPMMSLLKVGFNLSYRLRFRSHYGTQEECLFALQTFGIPVEVFPKVNKSGKLCVDKHVTLWKKRRELERQRLKQSDIKLTSILLPKRNDVLLGRGKGNHQYVGNIRYRNMLECHFMERYDKACRAEKSQLMRDVLEEVHKASGRFLQDSEFGLLEVTDDDAIDKIGHTFRTLRRAISQQRTTNNATSAVSVAKRGSKRASSTTLTSSSKEANQKSLEKNHNVSTSTKINDHRRTQAGQNEDTAWLIDLPFENWDVWKKLRLE